MKNLILFLATVCLLSCSLPSDHQKVGYLSIDGYVSANMNLKQLHDGLIILQKQHDIDVDVLNHEMNETEGEIMMIHYRFEVASYNEIK